MVQVRALTQNKLPEWLRSGYGYGSGDGYGDGYGYGYGYGDGDGYGYGDGSGYSYGDGEFWASAVDFFAKKMPPAIQRRMGELKKAGVKIAYWLSHKNGQPANGGSKLDTPSPGVIHTSSGPLKLCSAGTLHATLIPPKWTGERWWLVALHGDVIGDDEKYGCLKREILGECL